jgi:hypothetical protein
MMAIGFLLAVEWRKPIDIDKFTWERMKWFVAYLLPLNLALDARHCDERLTSGGGSFD